MDKYVSDAGGARRLFTRIGPVLIAVLVIVAAFAMAPMG